MATRHTSDMVGASREDSPVCALPQTIRRRPETEELPFGPDGAGTPRATSSMTRKSSTCWRRLDRLDHPGSIRPATYETLFGLMASAGLRVSEALHLRDADVDLKRGLLTIRQTKFAKSRLLPVHRRRSPHWRNTARPRTASWRGCGYAVSDQQSWPATGKPLSDRQAHRVFNALRDQVGWVNRGGHAAIRLHDLRIPSSFVA